MDNKNIVSIFASVHKRISVIKKGRGIRPVEALATL